MKAVLLIKYYFSKKTDLSLPLPQGFEKTSVRESKC